MAEMILGARQYIDAPPVTPLGGGIIAAAHVVDTDGHQLMGAQYVSDACADVNEWTEWCSTNPVARKLFEPGNEVIEGDPFAVYAGVNCDLQRVDEAKTRAERRLALAEGRGVDRHVLAQLDADAVDLGGPFPISQAIGVAEAYAATIYGGLPTLIIPRQFVPCAGIGVLRPNLDGTLTSLQGSLVANVTTEVDTPVADDGVIYVTGQITLLRGSVLSISVPQQPHGDGTFAPARALAERIYVPLFDCLIAKVDVSCS